MPFLRCRLPLIVEAFHSPPLGAVMPSALRPRAIRRGEMPAAYSAKIRRTISACLPSISRSPVLTDPSSSRRRTILVAIAVATRDFPGFDPAALSTPGLGRQVLEEQRVHGPLETDMELVDLALGQCQQADLRMLQAFEDRGGVFLVTADAVESFRDDDIDPACCTASRSDSIPGRLLRLPH